MVRGCLFSILSGRRACGGPSPAPPPNLPGKNARPQHAERTQQQQAAAAAEPSSRTKMQPPDQSSSLLSIQVALHLVRARPWQPVLPVFPIPHPSHRYPIRARPPAERCTAPLRGLHHPPQSSSTLVGFSLLSSSAPRSTLPLVDPRWMQLNCRRS